MFFNFGANVMKSTCKMQELLVVNFDLYDHYKASAIQSIMVDLMAYRQRVYYFRHIRASFARTFKSVLLRCQSLSLCESLERKECPDDQNGYFTDLSSYFFPSFIDFGFGPLALSQLCRSGFLYVLLFQ